MSGNVETCSCCWDQPPDGGDWSAEAGWRGRLEMGEGGPVSVVCEPLLPSLLQLRALGTKQARTAERARWCWSASAGRVYCGRGIGV